ncbi:MAG: hypothetical protein ACK4VI_02305 [Alphaproteobacteria bacterium]
MLGSSKTVLLISDEFLYVFSSGFKGMELMESVPWGSDNFEDNVSKIISKDCGGKPVVILNDMVEQYYRKERVPKVNVMDKKNIVNRKLSVAFPNYPIKAAFPLKEKIPKTEKLPAASVYIFAAAPQTEQYKKAMGAAKKSMASIIGYGLLPVEASGMVKSLSSKLAVRGKPKSKWSVFIGQHQHGGLRQVVIKDGELALTRMTPIVDSDSDVDVWANDVHQEFQATLSYMSRFGFTQEEGLDIVVVCNAAAGDAFSRLVEIDANIHTLTASQVARKLGLVVSSYVDQRYSDIIYATWVAKKASLALPMSAHEISSISNPRKIATAASVVLIAGAAYFSYEAFNQFGVYQDLENDFRNTRSRVAVLSADYADEIAKKEQLGFDVRLVQSSIELHDNLEKMNIKPIQLFGGIGRALGRDLRVDSVIVERVEAPSTPQPAPRRAARGRDQEDTQSQQPARVTYQARIQLTFPKTIDIDRGNREIDTLRERLLRALPNHEVVVDKYLKDTQYVDELVMGVDTRRRVEDLDQDFVVSLTIRGASS